MDRALQLFLVIAVVVCAIGSTTAIKCYTCTTITASTCGDPFESGTETDGCAQCSKAKAGDIVARTCLPAVTYANECTEQGDGSICSCNTDLCNSSSYVSVSMATTVCAGLILLFAKIL